MIRLLKGVLIGFACIIPEISAPTMAVTFNVYDKVVDALNHLYTKTTKSFHFLIPIVGGVLIGSVNLSFIIQCLSSQFQIQYYIFLIGLIVGGLPMIVKKIKIKRVNFWHTTIFLASFVFMISLREKGEIGTHLVPSMSIIDLFNVGLIVSFSMFVPGVNVLMMLDGLQPALKLFNGFLDSLVSCHVFAALKTMGMLWPFEFGIIIGIIALTKLTDRLLKKHETYTYCAILGLVIASPVSILMHFTITWTPMLFFSVVLSMIGGFVFSFILGKIE